MGAQGDAILVAVAEQGARIPGAVARIRGPAVLGGSALDSRQGRD